MDGVTYKPKNVVATFLDQYGETRVIHRSQGSGNKGLRVMKNGSTPVELLNRAAARLLGRAIKARRQSLGLSLEDLGVKAGLKSGNHKQYVWSIENAMRDKGVRLGTLYAIAAALDCEPGDLMPSGEEVRRVARVASKTITALAPHD